MVIHNFHGTVSWVAHSTISQSLYNRGRVTIWTLVKTSLWWNDELRLKFDQPLRWTISFSMSFVFVGHNIIFMLLFPSSFSFIDDDYDPSGKPFHIPCLPFRIPCFSCSLVKIWSFRCFFLGFLTSMMIKICNYISATLRIWEAICWMAEGGSKKRCYCRSRKRARSAAKRFARGAPFVRFNITMWQRTFDPIVKLLKFIVILSIKVFCIQTWWAGPLFDWDRWWGGKI